ncbi:uncharacterized protein HMPREF1541_09870 [Cyphellophora europaea CBS 101466]|uniref:Glycosyl transferase CAP10 domain-containing protein n=1 Tax=Cyphellophora europaea (strain CBS 101466) TaxID=1220924 RepID=W2SAR5_CYPE1|nr:uncharacterized protein HMPREF1541_09870 [Cyphellophora europaea CBS 101466]ETN44994.1 hypothetical protein HMPREF1541_09870 [Cyphellophora europaea CBS 101466]
MRWNQSGSLPLARKPRLLLILVLLIVLSYWQLSNLQRGIIDVYSSVNPQNAVHPLEAAVAAAEQNFVRLLSRQSQSIEAATAEYTRRYSLEPPPNFDKWFELARQNEFVLVDEFDTIMESLAPFRKVPGEELRRLVDRAMSQLPEQLLRYEIRKGKFSAEAGSGPSWFANSMRSFLPWDWLALLPDMTAVMNVYDEPKVVIPKVTSDATPAGTLLFSDLAQKDVWPSVKLGCEPIAPARSVVCEALKQPAIEMITDLAKSKDVCSSCDLHKQEGFLLAPANLQLTHLPVPIMSQAKPSVFSDILFPSPHYWGGNEVSDAVKWEDKASTLYWTGSATGGYAKDDNWMHMQRQRLALMLSNGSSSPIQLLKYATSAGWRTYNSTADGIADIVQVRITGTTGQCESAICEEEKNVFGIGVEELRDPESEIHLHKFLLDLDGNSFSGRYHRLLRTNSVVLKQTVFQEWHDDRLLPWLHFIPISTSFEELPEVVRFLAKTDVGNALARKIALNSRDWAEKALRHVDMQLVLLRTLLELGRILGD